MGVDLRQKRKEKKRKEKKWKWLTISQGTQSATTSLFTIRHVDIIVLHFGKVFRPQGSVLSEGTQVR
jgi:hypothetical protein